MKRLVWLSLGAAGGILVYRKGTAVVEQVREQGFMVTSSQALVAGKQLVQQAQQFVASNLEGPDRGVR